MKKLLILLAAIGLCACDSQQARMNVESGFPNAEIQYVPSRYYEFLVRTTNDDVYYIYESGCGIHAPCYTNLIYRGRK